MISIIITQKQMTVGNRGSVVIYIFGTIENAQRRP
jgi:hypothetical protein